MSAVLSEDPAHLNWRCPKCGAWNETSVKLRPMVAGEKAFGRVVNCDSCRFVVALALA